MKLAVLFTTLAACSAFAPPAAVPSSPSALKSNPSLDPSVGVTEPLGLFDPLGWLDGNKDPATNFASFHANFERRRAVERKHGRVAMAAVVGMLFHNAGIEFPGYLSTSENMRFSDVPDGFTGLFSIPTAGLAQIFFFCGVCEVSCIGTFREAREMKTYILSLPNYSSPSGLLTTTAVTMAVDMAVLLCPMYSRERSSSTSSTWRSTKDVRR